MTTILFLSITFLLFWGFSTLNIKRVINTSREFRGLMYHSDIIKFFLSSSMLIFLILSIYILFYNWKLFLILVLISKIIEKNIIIPLVEEVMSLVIDKIENKIDKKNNK